MVRKVGEAERELKDLNSEFQREREDMLDTIRQLARQIKLKETLLAHFVPLDKARSPARRNCGVPRIVARSGSVAELRMVRTAPA